MKILLLAFFVVAVSSSPLESCRWEKKHWCASLKIAKECDAVEECIKTTWDAPLPVTERDDICQYCENIITDVRDFISNNETEEMIRNFLDQACSTIPISQLADDCKSAVDNNLPELFQMIRAELDPKVVCAAIGLCSGLKEDLAVADSFFNAALIQGVPSRQKPSSHNGDICVDCKAFAADLMAKLATKPVEQEIEAVFKEFCQILGTMSKECESVVDIYLPEIITLLSEEVSPEEICTYINICVSGKKGQLRLAKMKLAKSPLYQAARKIESAEECVICKTFVGELQKLDRDKTLQADVENFVKQELCTRLGSLEKECEETVDNYAPMIFELLVNEMDPDAVCNSLGFCSASNSVEATIRKVSPSSKIQKPFIKSSAECVLCEFVMKEVEDLLKDNSSEAMIVEALDKVCSLLPDTIKEQCTTFVDTYAPAIILLLTQELDPQEVCTALGLCSQSKTLQFKPAPVTFIKSPVTISKGELCGVCETIIQYVDSLLEENSTVQEIEAVLDKVCNYLPSDLKTQCNDFIAQYGPAIIQLIAQFADPKEICTELKLCTAASNELLQNMVELAPAQPLLGAKKCSWGPAYWCANRDNAKACNAVSHCEKHVWKGN